jgi:hypothetical protein
MHSNDSQPKSLLQATIPVLWWIAIWGLTEMAIEWAVKNHIPSRLIFYIGVILIITGLSVYQPHLTKHL